MCVCVYAQLQKSDVLAEISLLQNDEGKQQLPVVDHTKNRTAIKLKGGGNPDLSYFNIKDWKHLYATHILMCTALSAQPAGEATSDICLHPPLIQIQAES